MDVDDILAFNHITKDNDESEAIAIANDLNFDYEEYKQRILGKEKEADFIVVLKSLGVLNHFEAYDESLSHLTGEYTPDFRVELKDGYSMLIEVKHTDKDCYKISSGNLQKRIDYAKRQDLPLRFAVSLKGVWGLFTAETLQSNSGKLTIDDFHGSKSKSCLDMELDTCSYIFAKQIKIKSVYSTDYPKAMDFKFEPYGQLVSYELYYDDKRIFRAKGKESPWLTDIFMLEALQDRISNIHQDITKNDEFTMITEYSDVGVYQIIPEYEFFLASIKHLTREIDSKNIRYDSISAIKERSFNFIPASALRYVMSKLVDNGVDLIVLRDNKGYRFNRYVEMFWHNENNENEN